MFRILIATVLLAGGCARPAPQANTASVDIGQAAQAAQGTVNAYADTVADHAEREAAAHKSTKVTTEPTPRAPGTPGGLPDDRTPLSEAPFTADSAQGAADVVQTYYALIGEGQFARARALWTPGAAGAAESDAVFAERFARYASYHAQVGAPGAIDAGAGQRYVTVPVQITARLRQGGAAVFEIGSATLHRTGDVDGATAAQRRWHLQSIDLKPAPPIAPSPSARRNPNKR